ncbi:endonuclease III [bacterium]|nr:endonuclease III [bacterium]
MNKSQTILKKIESLFPDAKSELGNWKTPFQFLICIILSAQTTDKKVNTVTSKLFDKYPTSKKLSMANISDIEELIAGVNYFKSKAKYLVETAQTLETNFGGVVPDTVDELIRLKGVGIKTANVFLNDLYKKNEGIGADTHVIRVAQRMGLTKHSDPKKVALDLQKLYPQEVWHRVNSTFVLYGRYVCKARMNESRCILKEYCSYCKDK